MTEKEIQKFKDELKDLHIEFLKSLNKELLEQLKWQPIETAPKDESEILIYDNKQKTYLFIYARCLKSILKSKVNKFNPTHWMPLPKPPQQ